MYEALQLGIEIANTISSKIKVAEISKDIPKLKQQLGEEQFFQLVSSGFFNHFRKQMPIDEWIKFSDENLTEMNNVLKHFF